MKLDLNPSFSLSLTYHDSWNLVYTLSILYPICPLHALYALYAIYPFYPLYPLSWHMLKQDIWKLCLNPLGSNPLDLNHECNVMKMIHYMSSLSYCQKQAKLSSVFLNIMIRRKSLGPCTCSPPRASAIWVDPIWSLMITSAVAARYCFQ